MKALLAIYRCSQRCPEHFVDSANCMFVKDQQEQVMQMAMTADASLLLAALSLGGNRYCSQDKRRIIKTGMDAYQKLSRCCPESDIYSYLARHYVDVYEVLQTAVEALDCDDSVDQLQKSASIILHQISVGASRPLPGSDNNRYTYSVEGPLH